MSIYRIDPDLPATTKTKLLNDMILELYGMVSQGKFDNNELDMLFNILPSDRKFIRNTGIGNTTSTYTSWSHIQAESGYSIWKYTPTSYTYNVLNELYMNDQLLENRGSAGAESATSFDTAFLYNGDSGSGYVTNTTEAATELGTDFAVMNTKQDYLYLGEATTFSGVKFEWHTRGSNYTLVVEYWNGSAWSALDEDANSLEDGTSNFESDGHISFTIPSDWATTSVNSVTKYWLRIYTTTDPVTIARAYYIIPNDSVIGLLALSSEEILNNEWAWCSYNSSIYATIPNAGASTVEGNLFINSASTSANKQNFFVYNKPFTANYEDSTYLAIKTVSSAYTITDSDRVIFIDASLQSVQLTLPTAVGRAGYCYIIKLKDLGGSGRVATVRAPATQTIDGATTFAFTADFQAAWIMSNGTQWFVIARRT